MTNIQSFKRDRPTIGVLASWTTVESISLGHYFASVLGGIQSAARMRECNLFLSWGIRSNISNNRIYPAWPVVSPESDFVPVGPWNTDGLIVFSPLQSETKSLYIHQLIAESHPILFIGTGEQGPQLTGDNRTGIRQAMTHLVEHGHHRIAFIAGIPTDKGDSNTRLEAYHEAVTGHNLEADPGLVVWGWHDLKEGYKAMQTLLASGIKFTAVLASNDDSAIGAMQAIREAGLRIPADIAIIGFDDQRVAAMQVPPLSSIHVPLRLIGEQALVMMLYQLTHQAPLESVYIPTRLMRRQSCGCMPEDAFAVVDPASRAESVPPHQVKKDEGTQEQREQVVNEMMNTLPSELRFPGGEQIQQICNTLVEALYMSLRQDNPTHFQTAFIESIHELEIADANIDYWQEMISILRREMMQLPLMWGQDSRTRILAEEMLHRARTVVSESAHQQNYRHQYQLAVDTLALHTLTAHLSTALSERQMLEILNANLARVGIRHARVMFFEAEQDDPVAWSVVLNVDVDPTPHRFLSQEFPPPGLYPPGKPLNIVLLPLIFQDEVLGYAAFDANDLGSCTVIARQLAATIKVSRLHAQVVELSLTDPLTGLHNRRYLDLFLANEIARAHRYSHELSIIMIDIDHFKDHNDQFGHSAGDEALRQVAGCLTNGRRTTDVVARIGGEEFAVVLPETDINGALKCAEKLRVSVAAISDLKHPITISLGIAMPNKDIYKAETLLSQADQALYEAKKTGRNRICIYQGKITDR